MRMQENKAQEYIATYALATGARAVKRLLVLHDVCAPVGKRVLLQAGLKPGMRVADFGCGIGATTRMLSGIVSNSGRVTGIDISVAQLEQARTICKNEGFTNVSFLEADACRTGLPRQSFDLVYCRFLLLHLPDPAACLREMRDVLKPGGVVVVEDGDLATATSVPPTALNAFADLFSRFGKVRGLNYSLSGSLYHLVKAAGFHEPQIEIHQPTMSRGENRLLLKWSVEEAGPSFVEACLITPGCLEEILGQMQIATDDPEVLVLGPRMSAVWARKQGNGFDAYKRCERKS